jgi:hypothetical protein
VEIKLVTAEDSHSTCIEFTASSVDNRGRFEVVPSGKGSEPSW